MRFEVREQRARIDSEQPVLAIVRVCPRWGNPLLVDSHRQTQPLLADSQVRIAPQVQVIDRLEPSVP